MKSLYTTLIVIVLSLFPNVMCCQNAVKLFNATGNKEMFTEIYCYNTTIDRIYEHFHSDNNLYRNFQEDTSPFWKDSSTITEKEGRITDKLSQLLIEKDSVQLQETIADSISPVLILLFLREELEARGINPYPSKGKQPANYYAEISSCQCHYTINSLRVKKNKYTGNYRVEYVVKWKERGMKKTIPLESETREHIAYEWERKHRTDMKEIPNLSVSMTEICRKIAQEKAGQIAAILEKEN